MADDEHIRQLATNPKVRQLVLDLGHSESTSEADFIVSAGNELAYAHILAFPDWPGPLTLIVGPPKVGKSHLAGIWRERADALVASPDTIAALAQEAGQQPVLVENADERGYPEAGLFHLLNQSMRDRRPVVMTARMEPQDWPLATEDVRSRVRLAARFDLAADDDMQLSQMFVKLFSDRQIAVDPGVIGYLVKRMERAPQEAVALVSLMDGIALSRRSAVTRGIAADAIAARAAHRDEDLPETEDTEDAPQHG